MGQGVAAATEDDFSFDISLLVILEEIVTKLIGTTRGQYAIAVVLLGLCLELEGMLKESLG